MSSINYLTERISQGLHTHFQEREGSTLVTVGPAPHAQAAAWTGTESRPKVAVWARPCLLSLSWAASRSEPSLDSVSPSAHQSFSYPKSCYGNELRVFLLLQIHLCVSFGSTTRIETLNTFLDAGSEAKEGVTLLYISYLTVFQKAHHRKKLALASQS